MDDPTTLLARLAVLAPMVLFHCPGMCGPLMVAFRFGWRSEAAAPRTLLATGELLAYQGSRLVVYISAGALAGWAGGRLVHAINRGALWLSVILAASFLFAACAKLGWLPWRRKQPEATPSFAQTLARRVTTLFPGRRLPSAAALGFAMAFLPCGLTFYALAMAADSASPIEGALLLGLLVVMTTPVLAPFALFSAFGLARFQSLRRHERWVVAVSLLIAAGIILWLGIARAQSGHCPWCPPGEA
jgi:sulfite exporter TauE/SafE